MTGGGAGFADDGLMRHGVNGAGGEWARRSAISQLRRSGCAGREPRAAAYFGRGGLIMMWAPGVPGNISHGAPGPGVVGNPVDSAVAFGV